MLILMIFVRVESCIFSQFFVPSFACIFAYAKCTSSCIY